MISSISSVRVNRSYVPNFRGRQSQQNAEKQEIQIDENVANEILKKSRKDARDGMIAGGLITLVGCGIYALLSRGKSVR